MWDAFGDQPLLLTRTGLCSLDLQHWSNSLIINFKKEIAKISRELSLLQDKDDDVFIYVDNGLKVDMNKLLEEEETYWKQHAMLFWLKERDFNSRFFHAQTVQKRSNSIAALQNSDGEWFSDIDWLGTMCIDYLTDLFSLSNGTYDPVVNLIQATIFSLDNEKLLAPVSANEV